MKNDLRRRHARCASLAAVAVSLLPWCKQEAPVMAGEPEQATTLEIRPLPVLPPPAAEVHWTMDRIVDGVLPDAAGLYAAKVPELARKKDVKFGGSLPDFKPTNEPGVKGGALGLDRDQQGFVSVTASKPFDFTQGMTVTAWVKIESSSALMNILSCAEDLPNPQGGWTLCYSFGRVIFRAVDSAGKLHAIASPEQSVPARVWVHIAAVADATTLRIYLNGVEEASAAFAGPIRMAATPMVIGNHAGIAGYRHAECPAFGGLMDEVKIFQKPLSAADVMAESELALAPIR
jgi:hypothetical protein